MKAVNVDERRNMVSEAIKIGYEAGLKDAWECARRISDMPINELDDCFGESVMLLKQLFEKYSPEEVMTKLKEYEAKQTDFLQKYEGKWVQK